MFNERRMQGQETPILEDGDSIEKGRVGERLEIGQLWPSREMNIRVTSFMKSRGQCLVTN